MLQKDFQARESKYVTWNYCIQNLHFPSSIVDFEQVNTAKVITNQMRYNKALLINPSDFKIPRFCKSFLLWLFRALYWDPNLLSRWHQIQLKKLRKAEKTWTVHQLNHFCRIFGLTYTSLSPLYKINSWAINLSLTSQISMTWTA